MFFLNKNRIKFRWPIYSQWQLHRFINYKHVSLTLITDHITYIVTIHDCDNKNCDKKTRQIGINLGYENTSFISQRECWYLLYKKWR